MSDIFNERIFMSQEKWQANVKNLIKVFRKFLRPLLKDEGN